MQKKIRIRLDNDLSLIERDRDKIRSYETDIVFQFLAPMSNSYSVYGVAKAKTSKNAQDARSLDVDRHRVKKVGQEEIEGELYNVFEFVPRSIVYSSVQARNLEVNILFEEYNDERMLGTEFIPSETDVNQFLKDNYTNAKSGDIVRVQSEDSDWEFNGTDWIDLEEYASIYITRFNSQLEGFTIERSRTSTVPEHEPTATELIYSELDDRYTKAEADALFYDKIESDERFVKKSDYNPKQTEQDNRLTNLEGDRLFKSGSNADPDISINGTTFNHNRATDAIEGAEFDARATTVDNRFNSVEGNIDDIYDLLDLDGDL